MKHLLAISAVLALAGCDRPPDQPFDTVGTDSATSTTGAKPTTTKGGLDTGSGGAPPLDVHDGESPSCGPIDFLFVVDNSVSMADEVDDLHAAIPGLLLGIGAGDHRFMAVDTDQWNRVDCDTKCLESPPPMICVALNGVDCVTPPTPICEPLCAAWNSCYEDPGFTCTDPQPTECIDQLGGGQTFDCGVDKPWVSITEDGQAPVECILGSFEGNAYTVERPMGAMVGALLMQESCSQDFVRDGALLVIVILTDEADQSAGDPSTWQAIVKDAKGDLDDIVVVSLIRELGVGECLGDSPRIREFTEGFEHGIVASICSDYTEVFAEAADMVNAACVPG